MPWCERCDRWFNTDRALWQHEDNSSMHFKCTICDKDFVSSWARIQHYVQSNAHAYCQQCDRHFDDFDELQDHYEEDHHYCNPCHQIFKSEVGLHEHRRQKHADRYCVECKRIFKHPNNLIQHRRSATHQGRTVICPFKGCGRAFVDGPALILHLESGTCPSRVDRRTINHVITSIDRGGTITNPARLLTGPTERAGGARVTDMWATERAWNGSCFECYLCHRGFGSLAALNAHLRSPTHDERLYRCPVRWHGCGSEFVTLSALWQHMESEQCGVYRFKADVDRLLDSATTLVRLLKV